MGVDTHLSMERTDQPTRLSLSDHFTESTFRWMPSWTPSTYDLAVTRERRQLGLGAAIAVVTGESIALGIFLTPAAMAKSLGSPLLLSLVWFAMALMAISGALCYSELAVRFPQSG